MSQGPSRARRQLAARLAAHKQQAAENPEGGEDSTHDQSNDHDLQWPTNPFVIAGLDEDADGTNSPASAAFPSSDFPHTNKDEPFSSPPFPDSGFSPPDSFSTNSSDEDGEGRPEGARRKDRVPLEVDEEEDDDMGEMVGPSLDSGMMDSDEEDEAIMNESLGYPDIGSGRYRSFRRSRIGMSPFGEDEDDSSDGEDDGLVEILVPGRKASTSSTSSH